MVLVQHRQRDSSRREDGTPPADPRGLDPAKTEGQTTRAHWPERRGTGRSPRSTVWGPPSSPDNSGSIRSFVAKIVHYFVREENISVRTTLKLELQKRSSERPSCACKDGGPTQSPCMFHSEDARFRSGLRTGQKSEEDLRLLRPMTSTSPARTTNRARA